jgi:hypothetical protein
MKPSNEASGFLRLKVLALPVTDLGRANKFYAETMNLEPAREGGEQVGYLLGETIIMLKSEWAGKASLDPIPRVTFSVRNAAETEAWLRERGVLTPDPIATYGEFLIGSFADSENNKLWYCSPVSW